MRMRAVLAGVVVGVVVAAGLGAAACSSTRSDDSPDTPAPRVGAETTLRPQVSPSRPASPAPTQPNHFAGPPDFTRSVVQRGARVDVARPFESLPLRDLPDAVPLEDRFEHEPGANPFSFAAHPESDPVLQSGLPIVAMPVTLQSFLGQGSTLGNCVFPRPDAGEPPGCTTLGDPPDTVGAVGPNHYVQLVNSGVAVWKKDGTVLVSPKFTSSLFTGMAATDGSHCGSPPRPSPPGGDWGDGVVLYDQMADRWVITQFDIANYANKSTGPSYQCVAVSKTGDPSGAYWLYDFQYSVQINDYGKFSVWPDAYYASYNDFNPFFTSANVCAWDRAAMLQGKPATQQCFTNPGFGFLPASVDGAVKPPSGEPGFFVNLDSGGSAIALYKFKVDWTTPGNSSFTGPTTLPVAAYNQLCAAGNCVVQPSPGNPLASLGDRPMFHLSYRNFGTVESLAFTHSVAAGTTGGIRWYEIRSPDGAPVVFQQGTYAPADGNYRWMGSLAQDQAQDFALGYTLSGTTTFPSIAWTGRVATDPAGTMGQAEAVVQAGAGAEIGKFKSGQLAERWGDYSNMTVDPSDDCTFWYTQEVYATSGTFNWDTRVSSVTFPNCAQNDFTIGLAPATQTVPPGSKATYTVTTALVKGTAETIALSIQDLPAGVTASFAPATVGAGTPSTLTLTTTAATPLTAAADTFTVIGKATSAVHPATARISVATCTKITTCPSPDNCGTISDGCGGTVNCGGACAALDSCHTAGTCTANVCSNPVAVNGTTCNDGNSCTTGDSCANGTCAGTPVVCTNGDACHDPGKCGGDAGTCSAATAKTDGTTCTGTDPCIQAYTCQAGTCAAGSPVVCKTLDECHDVGTCSSGNGTCSNPPKTDGTACSIGTCQGGTCTAPTTGSDAGPGDAGPGDAATTPDSGSGTQWDAAAPQDSGASGDAGGTNPPPGQGGGCGCRTVQATSGSPLGLAGIGVAFAAFGLRRRRNARRG